MQAPTTRRAMLPSRRARRQSDTAQVEPKKRRIIDHTVGARGRNSPANALVGAALLFLLVAVPVHVLRFRARTRLLTREEKTALVEDSRERFERFTTLLNEEAMTNEALERARRNLDLPIYYVNLDRSTDRRERLEETFARIGVRATRVPAIDGATEINIDELDGPLPATDVACRRSHMRALEMMLADGHSRALIVEDDVSFDAAHLWPRPLSEIVDELPEEWTGVQLYSSRVTWDAIGVGVDGNAARAVGGRVWGAVGIVIHAPWAATVLEMEKGYEAWHTSETGILHARGAIAFHVEPNLVWPANHDLESTLHESETPLHLWRAAQIAEVWYEKQLRLIRS